MCHTHIYIYMLYMYIKHMSSLKLYTAGDFPANLVSLPRRSSSSGNFLLAKAVVHSHVMPKGIARSTEHLGGWRVQATPTHRIHGTGIFTYMNG